MRYDNYGNAGPDYWNNPDMQLPDYYCPGGYPENFRGAYPGISPSPFHPKIYPMMYPDIYYKLYPYVCRICDKMDNPYVSYPSESLVENMVDECYDMSIREISELEEYAGAKAPVKKEVENQQFPYRRPILRDLISIILIGELLRRRRLMPYYGYGYEGGYYGY